MCKRDLFQQIISTVSEITEVGRDEILSRSRRSDVVEARCLAIYLMRQNRILPYQIAEFMDIPVRSVYYSITSFSIHSDQDGSMLKVWLNEAKSRLQKQCRNIDRTM